MPTLPRRGPQACQGHLFATRIFIRAHGDANRTPKCLQFSKQYSRAVLSQTSVAMSDQWPKVAELPPAPTMRLLLSVQEEHVSLSLKPSGPVPVQTKAPTKLFPFSSVSM